MKKGRLIGCLALVASAFLWATAYIAVKQLVAEVPPSVLLAFRFSFAAIILAVICIPKFKHYTKDLLFSGMKMGTAMFFEFFLFTVALQYTSASKSSFIIASYIIILPIVYLIIRRKKPTGSDVLASVICMVGICLLLANGLDSFNKGDLLSAGCALSYAVHIVYSSKFSKQYGVVSYQDIKNSFSCVCTEAVLKLSYFHDLLKGMIQITQLRMAVRLSEQYQACCLQRGYSD